MIIRASLNKKELSPRLLANTLHLLTLIVHMLEDESRTLHLPKYGDSVTFSAQPSEQFWKVETMSKSDFAAAVRSTECYTPAHIKEGTTLGSEASMTSSIGAIRSELNNNPMEDEKHSSVLDCLFNLFSDSNVDKQTKRSVHWLIRAIACLDEACADRSKTGKGGEEEIRFHHCEPEEEGHGTCDGKG